MSKLTTSPLDHSCYPFILDRVISYAPYPSLLKLRCTNRTLRARADALLRAHIVIRASSQRDTDSPAYVTNPSNQVLPGPLPFGSEVAHINTTRRFAQDVRTITFQGHVADDAIRHYACGRELETIRIAPDPAGYLWRTCPIVAPRMVTWCLLPPRRGENLARSVLDVLPVQGVERFVLNVSLAPRDPLFAAPDQVVLLSPLLTWPHSLRSLVLAFHLDDPIVDDGSDDTTAFEPVFRPLLQDIAVPRPITPRLLHPLHVIFVLTHDTGHSVQGQCAGRIKTCLEGWIQRCIDDKNQAIASARIVGRSEYERQVGWEQFELETTRELYPYRVTDEDSD